MRFAVPARSRELESLVLAFDRPEQPIAVTWRAVGHAAWRLGLTQPGYHLVRKLVHALRARQQALAGVRLTVAAAVAPVSWPPAVGLRIPLSRLVPRERRRALRQRRPP